MVVFCPLVTFSVLASAVSASCCMSRSVKVVPSTEVLDASAAALLCTADEEPVLAVGFVLGLLPPQAVRDAASMAAKINADTFFNISCTSVICCTVVVFSDVAKSVTPKT